MLKAVNLSHKFDYPLFSDLNLDINPATTTAITGVSGSGKSTILHILSTLLKPASGEVIYNEKSIYNINENELLKIRRLEFGIIFQAHYLFKGFNAYENIELANVLSGHKINIELLKKLKIDHVMNQKIGELSGGQQQRVSIARVMSKKPRIIFADEPTGNLDKNTANEVMDVIFDYVKNENAALVIVTHDEDLASKCDFKFRLSEQKLEQLS
ncbi:ABC transporter ATP-binding protein [Campylobacter hyointestinalis]|uniref:ABC transporter ATP-binding protein n=1 Tax=Campylobacter hyointestinalis subsp. hyointestinalis TaxID=91352 RepID=A0A855N6H3_CAMHY|nr:ABC transporter ATP-binding protein [Campylobacter hyointestinalis]KEA44460.1 ABC transporter ATP-binding protein [Campylobacter hyointestinalis subsp. hyointestinalis]PPB57768.1 ABC transporter ATP-binding protein [Campylobacter hyointestinalis subsp. hyointestinalis]PPB62604.1 ABC transporter ATP-binding protein [Campylobacter hyointestinalis subsp. hyointestinalis]PPB71262.1 ABC transporter ATP-binding protein [Campylobacter hyointestinalis subsp. hyointestinalis]QKF55192.1 ABC transport